MKEKLHMGSVVSKILTEKEKTQSWLAEIWKISRSAVSAQLNRPTLSSDKLIELSRALDVSILAFFPKDIWPEGYYNSRELDLSWRVEENNDLSRLNELLQLVEEQRKLLEVRQETINVLRQTVAELEARLKKK